MGPWEGAVRHSYLLPTLCGGPEQHAEEKDQQQTSLPYHTHHSLQSEKKYPFRNIDKSVAIYCEQPLWPSLNLRGSQVLAVFQQPLK
jgi:hypothetical protein